MTVARLVEWLSSDCKVFGTIPDPAINTKHNVEVSLSETLDPNMLLMPHHQCMAVCERVDAKPVV